MNRVIVGAKPMHVHLMPALIQLRDFGEVELTAIGSNIQKMEAIVSMLQMQIKLKKRYIRKYKDTNAVVMELVVDGAAAERS
jgi:DNA-binding protein